MPVQDTSLDGRSDDALRIRCQQMTIGNGDAIPWSSRNPGPPPEDDRIKPILCADQARDGTIKQQIRAFEQLADPEIGQYLRQEKFDGLWIRSELRRDESEAENLVSERVRRQGVQFSRGMSR